MTLTFRRLLLASTAATVIGYSGTAAAQTAEIDVASGAVTIAAGLEAFNVANSQVTDGATAVATVVTTGTLTGSVTDAAAVTVNQTLLANTVSALARLNQTTNTVQIQSPLAAGPTGAVEVNATIVAATENGVSLLNMQTQSDPVQALANVTDALMSLTVNAAGLTGANAVIAESSVVADVLMNDAVNSLTATGSGGNLAVPAALASVQRVNQVTTAVDATATVGTAAITVDLSLLTDALTGNAVIENNAVAARAGVNSAANELVAGSAAAPANGLGTAITLNPADASAGGVGTAGAGTAVNADYAVANFQTALGVGAVATITSADLTVLLPAAQDIVGGIASVSGNTILADANLNTATNRAIVTTAGVAGPSVAVGSAQFLDPNAPAGTNAFNAEVTNATLTIGGGQFDGDSDALVQGNTVAARFAGNVATNVLGLTGSGSLANGQAAIVGYQEVAPTNNAVAATAEVDTALLEINVNAAASTGNALSATGNTVEASAVLNNQTNLMVVSGGPAFGATARAPSQLVSSTQLITSASVTSTVDNATVNIVSGSGPTASVTAANNAIRASAMGNVSSNTISNTARSFSLGR